MKIALVLPPAEKVAEKKDTPNYQHIGLGYLAAVLEEHNYAVKVIDAKLERMDYKKTLESIKNYAPEVLGVTAMTHEINIASTIARESKALFPNVVTIVGGVHVTALPIETLEKYSSFDLGVLGEGEYSFLDILKLVKNKNFNFSALKGVVYRDKTGIKLSQPLERIVGINDLPFPAWHHFPNAREYIIITSRGCPFSCIFCMRAMGQQVRKRSVQNVIEEIEAVILTRKPDRFLFYDETFTLDRARVYELCDLMIKKGINKHISWSATTRVDSIDNQLLIKMREAGCDHIEFGVESGDQEVLNMIKKGITIEQAIIAVKAAKDLGFHTETAFILGHPHETMKTAYKTIYLASKLNADIAQLGIMVPYPDTEVAKMALEGKGDYRIISQNWSEYNKQLGNAMELEGLSRLDLERLQLIGYLKLFIMNKRFKDLFYFIWNYRREMSSFIKNHFKRYKTKTSSHVGLFLILKMIFSLSPELD